MTPHEFRCQMQVAEDDQRAAMSILVYATVAILAVVVTVLSVIVWSL